MGYFITEEQHAHYVTLKAQMQKILNKVNAVTVFHRHGQPVPPQKLTDLANRQIEVEEALRAHETIKANETNGDKNAEPAVT